MSLLFYRKQPNCGNFAEKMEEVNPADTSRAYAFQMWMKAPMPMVTFFKTLDVSRLVRLSRRHGVSAKPPPG